MPAASQAKFTEGTPLANGESKTLAGVAVEAIAAYDIKPGEPSHPKGKANGYVLTLGGKRIYIRGRHRVRAGGSRAAEYRHRVRADEPAARSDDARRRRGMRERVQAQGRLPVSLRPDVRVVWKSGTESGRNTSGFSRRAQNDVDRNC